MRFTNLPFLIQTMSLGTKLTRVFSEKQHIIVFEKNKKNLNHFLNDFNSPMNSIFHSNFISKVSSFFLHNSIVNT